MQIFTESIKKDLEIQLNKTIDEICSEELLQIKKLTINRVGFGDRFQQLNYEEVDLFENLEEITLFNCMINDLLIENILKLNKLKILKIYNCDFVDLTENMFNNLHIEELTISNCIGLRNVIIKYLIYLELKNIEMNFWIKNVGILNLSKLNTKIRVGNIENVKKIIISKENYNDKKYISIHSEITIVDDKMNMLEEIKDEKN